MWASGELVWQTLGQSVAAVGTTHCPADTGPRAGWGASCTADSEGGARQSDGGATVALPRHGKFQEFERLEELEEFGSV